MRQEIMHTKWKETKLYNIKIFFWSCSFLAHLALLITMTYLAPLALLVDVTYLATTITYMKYRIHKKTKHELKYM